VDSATEIFDGYLLTAYVAELELPQRLRPLLFGNAPNRSPHDPAFVPSIVWAGGRGGL
jgi:hypothetical protein